MHILILALIVINIAVLILHQREKRKAKKRTDEIRANWGKPKNELFDFDHIRAYSEILKKYSFHRLTDQTLEDIDFRALFEFVDRTTSKVGQQFLYKILTQPTNNSTNTRNKFINLFFDNTELREAIQLQLARLNNNGAFFIASLLRDRLLEKPKWFNLLYLNVIVLGILLVISFQFPILIIALILVVTLNMFLHYWNRGRAFRFIQSFPQLNNLIIVAETLLKTNILFHDQQVKEGIGKLKPFQQTVLLLKFHGGGSLQSELSLIGTYLIELIKGILLIEVFALHRIVGELEGKREPIQTIFEYVGGLDLAISICSLRAGNEKTCVPKFTASTKEMVAKNIYHPLIKDCVPNDLVIKNKSILITGSNMSGKSTFLRTLIINSILAQTIHTCFADEFISPILKQFSSIRIDDNLFDGRSYYFEEVNIMGSLLEQAEYSHQNFFVLDEVFKGTNTIERIASGKAILSYLNRKENIVVVSTHDIELAELLADEYDLYHFTESVENNELIFDHKIKPGELKTRNAIKILELSSYPKAIIDEAKTISHAILQNKKPVS